MPAEVPPVAVVSMGVAVAGATSPDELWKLLDSGIPALGQPPSDRWSAQDFAGDGGAKTYQQTGGYATGLAPPPGEDHATTWLRHCARQALDGVQRAQGVAVYLGYTPDGSLRQEEALVRDRLLGVLDEPHRAAVARHFGAAGAADRYLPHRVVRDAVRGLVSDGAPLYLLDTACSSAMYAIDAAMRDVLAGRVDLALCGGAVVVTPTNTVLFARNRGLSRTGCVRALDTAADGTLFGDGAAVLALKRLDRALADGDTVHGVILGSGLSADGHGTAIYAPSAAGQQRAIRHALARSGLGPEDIGLVITHGTGTSVGDAVELAALRACYPHSPALASNKSLIGHTAWAAGAVSVIHLLLALRHGRIPAQPLVEHPSTAGVPVTAVDWPADRLRAGAVSGFGFGGTNAHLIIQEYRPGDAPAGGHRYRPAPLVVVGWAAHRGPVTELPFDELRLPQKTIRRMDPTQVMLIDCMHRLPADVRAACLHTADRTGVVIGHSGLTRSAVRYGTLARLDEVRRVAPGAGPSVDRLRDEAPEPTEDSFPGKLPNIISGRLSNYFDLRGPTVVVDHGDASLIAAFETAARYLAFGDLDLALVGAANGNTLAALGREHATEGAYLFAFTTRRFADREGLPVLAEWDPDAAGGDPATSDVYLAGADGGDVLAAFLGGGTGNAVAVRRRPIPGEPEHRLGLRRPTDVLTRHTLSYAARPRRPVRPVVPFFAPGAAVLTNLPRAAFPAGVAFDGAAPRHIRVVGDPDAPGLLALHDAMFLAARTPVDSFLVLLYGGVQNPLTGLFTGFVKALAQELGGTTTVLAVVHDSRDLATALRDAEAETSAARLFPVVRYRDGERQILRAEPAPVPEGAFPLDRDSVVVTAGGGRGVGAEILRALAARTAPRIFLLGTTEPAESVVIASRVEYIQRRASGVSPAAAGAAHDDLLRRVELRRTLNELSARCDVTYLACDLRDAEQTRQAVDAIVDAVGRVDLLLNVAGVLRTGAVADKSLADFRAVRDLKVLAHTHLTRAFAGRRPSMWCNFGSYAGFFGVPGDTDYAAANDFLYAAAESGEDEYTVGFGWWGETGLVSTPIWRSRIAAEGRLTPMTTAEGLRHFLTELTAREPAVQIGPRERASLDRAAPGYLAWARGVPDHFIDEVSACDGEELTAVRVFDTARDGWLDDHVIAGYPTVPGSFYPEIAAEVAVRLCPDRVVVAFEDLSFEGFLRVYAPDRPQRVRITARRVAADLVEVRVGSDVVATTGRYLRERLHGRLSVRLADALPIGPLWTSAAGAPGRQLVNPLYAGLSHTRVAGMFRTTPDGRRLTGGWQGKLRLDETALRRWFPRTVVPVLLIEGVFQLPVLQPAGGPFSFPVPHAIERIELYEGAGSVSRARLYGMAAPAGPFHAAQLVAVGTDHRVVARVLGVTTAVVDRHPVEV